MSEDNAESSPQPVTEKEEGTPDGEKLEKKEEATTPTEKKGFFAKRRDSLVLRSHSRKSSSGNLSASGSLPSLSSQTPLFGRKLSVDPEEPMDKGHLIKKGQLVLGEKKKAKEYRFELTSTMFHSVDGMTRISLKSITAILGGGEEKNFALMAGMHKSAVISCENEEEMKEWMLVLNDACVLFGGSLGILSYSTKVILLNESLGKFVGGVAKREEIEEEWQYRKSGALILQAKVPVNYKWDGMNLTPTKGVAFGKGVFDGLTLSWFPPQGVEIGFEKKKKKFKKTASRTKKKLVPEG